MFGMPKVTCNKCGREFEFQELWFKKNNKEEFVCRNCKIRIRTQSDTFKRKQSARSKVALSDPNIKERMSQRATLSNIKNADKISKSVKKHYEDYDNLQKAKKRSQERWQDPEYRKTVSNGLKEKWQDPEYRGKVLGSRAHYKKRNSKLEQDLSKKGLKFIPNYTISHYEFDAFINGKYLYDKQPSNEKRLFIEHYFTDLVYISDLELALKLES